MAAPGVTLVKSFDYRGVPEEFSNTYHFLGSAPSDPTGWRALVDALVVKEKALFLSGVHIVRAYCYANTDDSSVYSYDLSVFAGTVAGTLATGSSGSVEAPGDVAFMARWDTGRHNSKGRAIYLRKYWHGAYLSSSSKDRIATAQLNAVTSFADTIRAVIGAWPGLAGPDHAAVVGFHAEPNVTTRTLKRRGKRGGS